MALGNPQVPDTTRKGLLLLMERMERGVEAILNTVDFIPNPDEILVHTGEMRNIFEPTGAQGAVSGDPNAQETLTGDLGGGVV
jgi:hypothetical protein